jgi:hypothetical protein
MENLETIKSELRTLFFEMAGHSIYFIDCGQTLCIETRSCKNPLLNGMQILYFIQDGLFEVSEYMAGPKQNQLRVLTETKSLKIAVKSYLKGNKGRKAIKIWE